MKIFTIFASLTLFLLLASCKPREKQSLFELMEPTEEMIAHGKKEFQRHCAQCHGEGGQGDGRAGVVLQTRPRDFHSEIKSWKRGKSTLLMYETITEGYKLMPSFRYLSPETRMSIVHYIHDNFMEEWPIDDPETIRRIAGSPPPSWSPPGSEKIDSPDESDENSPTSGDLQNSNRTNES